MENFVLRRGLMLLHLRTFLFRFLLLLVIPTIACPAQPEPLHSLLPRLQAQVRGVSYDDILDWIEAIENDELADRYTPLQVEKAAQFLSLLASKGSASSNPMVCRLLERDIETLLCDCRTFQFAPYEGGYSIESAVLYGAAQTIPCKSWVKKQCSHLKKFARKHKTALIIGAAVVVAAIAVIAVVAITATATTAASTAAAAAGATASGLSKNGEQEEQPPTGSQLQDPVVQELAVDPVQAVEQALPLLASAGIAQAIEETMGPVQESLVHEAVMEEMTIDVKVEKLGGARFTGDGKRLIGFLEQ